MSSYEVVRELEREGFGVKLAEDGIVTYLDGRKPSRHELVDAVPELEECPTGRVAEGVFILIGEEPFVIRGAEDGTQKRSGLLS